jgi:hypothetical protein
MTAAPKQTTAKRSAGSEKRLGARPEPSGSAWRCKESRSQGVPAGSDAIRRYC